MEKTQEIRNRKGNIISIPRLSRSDAIKLFCTQCLGYENHPKDCKVDTCPLYFYRGITRIGQISDEQYEKMRELAKESFGWK